MAKLKLKMQFMADVHLQCESCGGKRYKEEILEIKFKNKSIFDILDFTVDEAIEFFETNGETKITHRIKLLQDVGLGYVKLGQASSTLSGGESQRVKLASFLSEKDSKNPMLFIFDEPTTGLHFHDIRKLLDAFNALIKNGHSLIVIEHNIDIIKSADWIIDLGPEGGDSGGFIVYEGVPEGIVKCEKSYTGKYLKGKVY
jgi:excinuclease ABC subunit A